MARISQWYVGLVRRIVRKIMKATKYRLEYLHVGDDVNGEGLYVLFNGEVIVGESSQRYWLTYHLYVEAKPWMGGLKPETLGRIISTGMNERAAPFDRTRMTRIRTGDGLPEGEDDLANEVFFDPGIMVLRRFAAVVIAAAIWDVLLENILPVRMNAEQVAELQAKRPLSH